MSSATVIVVALVVLGVAAVAVLVATDSIPSAWNGSALSLHNRSADPWYPVRVDLIRWFPDPSWGPDRNRAPQVIRLAWHGAATYSKVTGRFGTFGGTTIRLAGAEKNDPDNRGLDRLMDAMEPIKARHPWMSYGDLYAFAGITAVAYLGGPTVRFRPGRTDTTDTSRIPPNGFLPDGALGNQVPKGGGSAPGVLHMRAVFTRLDCSDADAIALMIGGHSVGHMFLQNSGFEGKWSHQSLQFSNAYAKALLNLNFSPMRTSRGKLQFRDTGTRVLTMMPIEMALLTDESYRSWLVKFNLDPGAFYAAFARAYEKILENGRPL